MDITIYQINMGRDHNRIAFEGLDLLKMVPGKLQKGNTFFGLSAAATVREAV